MPAPSITEEEHFNIWKQLKTNHLDRYQLQRMDSRDDLDSQVTDQRRVSLPGAYAQVQPSTSSNNRRLSIVQDPFSTDITSFFNANHKQATAGRRYSVAASQINSSSLYPGYDLSSVYNLKKDVENTRRDVVIKDEGIILYGDLKKKKLLDSLTWQVPVYEEIIIERITGHGKLYYCNYSSSDKLKKIYDSASISQEDGSLTCNTKFLQLHNSSTYFFKFVKYSPQDTITFSFRNKSVGL
ncbi:predicted protein [Naegleria gruberi]|uniref:Predicted protein n=1 Tax=Naegleria gruberi TaxID=5762 RepID=D2VCP9_NAEGR|nr:uncharacterized protein NAEGRDRAFT_48478 [Naegleria gruberi]EFC45344.1 predicted protein [Naegleria gruberi]|eukprot:XP_002678088.1 predicted protein [Naegleria gruberi strain NEG-M]